MLQITLKYGSYQGINVIKRQLLLKDFCDHKTQKQALGVYIMTGTRCSVQMRQKLNIFVMYSIGCLA